MDHLLNGIGELIFSLFYSDQVWLKKNQPFCIWHGKGRATGGGGVYAIAFIPFVK